SGSNPGANDGDLFALWLLRLLRRHEGLAFPLNLQYERALVRIARHDRRPTPAAFHQQLERFHVQPALRLVAAVAFEAVASEEGFDLLGVARRLLSAGTRGDC